MWLALDRSAESGPYDRLYVDADLDNSLADEQPVKADQRRGSSQGSAFHMIKLRLPGEDGPVSYHLNVTYRAGAGGMCYVEAAGWHEGPVTVGGKKLWCTLIDNNGNGRFGDSGVDRSQCDLIRIAPKDNRSYHEYGKDTRTRSVGRLPGVSWFQSVPVHSHISLVPVPPIMTTFLRFLS